MAESDCVEVVRDLVSTVIPVFNRPGMLRTCVDSVLAQTHRPIEIVIVDDGSTDNTLSIAKELANESPEIVRWATIENSGPGPAREAGRQMANGEYIQYLDSDDRLLPNKFADQIAALKAHPDADIAYGITRLIDERGEVLAEPFKWTDREIPELFPGLLVDRWWCTHTPLYRRSLTDRVGPWSDMRWSQDWEIDSRAGALNATLVHCGTLVSEHVHHGGERQTSSASWTTDPVRLRNRVQLLKSLWSNCQESGTDRTSPEFQHFARWCFSIARQCAVQGLTSETKELLEIAKESAGQGKGNRGVQLFSQCQLLLGTRLTGILFRSSERIMSRRSNATMAQSFAGQISDSL